MKYLDRLKAAGDDKKVFAGGQAPPKPTKPPEMPISVLTKPTKLGSVSSAGTEPPTKKSCEFPSGDVEADAEDSPAATLTPVQKSARREVLAQLEAHPTVKRAVVNRFEPDGTMIVTLGIRDVGTGELKIPADRFNQDTLDDYAALLNIIGGTAA